MKKKVVLCFVKNKKKYLFLKRSERVSYFHHLWSPVAGALENDEAHKIRAIAELKEEANIDENNIKSVKEFLQEEEDDKINKIHWIRIPFLIEIKDIKKIKIDWEHDSFSWFTYEESLQLEMPPQTKEIFNKIIVSSFS